MIVFAGDKRMKDINGHKLKSDVKSFYEGKKVSYWCIHEGCYFDIQGEYNVYERANKLAEEYPCPLADNRCMECDEYILPDRDICITCKAGLDSSRLLMDRDEEGYIRGSVFQQ